MFRLSTWLTLGAILALVFGWALKGAPLGQHKTAGWSDFGTWGWGEASSARMETTAGKSAAGESTKTAAAGPATKHAEKPATKPADRSAEKHAAAKPPKPAPQPDDAGPAAGSLESFEELASKGIELEVEVPGLSKKPGPATGGQSSLATGIPHPDPWPVATEVPDWGAIMKVRTAEVGMQADIPPPADTVAIDDGAGAASALPWPIATEVPNWGDVMKVRMATGDIESAVVAAVDAAAESAAALGTSGDAVAVTDALPWPIATDVPDWGAVMKVRIAADQSDASADAEGSMTVAEVGVPHPFPWPIATEVPDWGAAMKVPALAMEADTSGEAATGVPHPFPWPVAQESVTWDIGPRDGAMAAAAPAPGEAAAGSTAVGVPHPFPWPIAQQSIKWDIGPRMAAAPDDLDRKGMTGEQKSCEDELRRIYASGTILFKTNSAVLDAKSTETLVRLAAAAKACAKVRIRVEGHTDSRGSDAVNLSLSQRRAQAIADALKKAGVAGDAVTAQGFGKQKPIAPNDTEENMAKNRRIEFSVY